MLMNINLIYLNYTQMNSKVFDVNRDVLCTFIFTFPFTCSCSCYAYKTTRIKIFPRTFRKQLDWKFMNFLCDKIIMFHPFSFRYRAERSRDKFTFVRRKLPFSINKKSFYILYLMFMRSEIIFSYKLDESGGKDTEKRYKNLRTYTIFRRT